MSYNAEKFWANVDVRGVGDCWLWQGRSHAGEYGVWKGQGAHRMALWLSGVKLDSRHDCHHVCGQKLCCSPFHLQVLMHADHGRVTASERNQPTKEN